ncbi:MAG: phospholipase, partial [Flavobacteriaceae bacterium]
MLDYNIRLAESSKNQNSAIFLIHGYGSNAEDLFSFAPYLPKDHTIIALQAPLSLGLGGYAWYPLEINELGEVTSKAEAAETALKTVVKNIDELINKYDLNSQDLTLLGFSQGAILSWALGFNFPGKIRRIIALSGWIHESIDSSNPPQFVAYAAHGTEDAVIPIHKARESILPLSEQFEGIEYYEFTDG